MYNSAFLCPFRSVAFGAGLAFLSTGATANAQIGSQIVAHLDAGETILIPSLRADADSTSSSEHLLPDAPDVQSDTNHQVVTAAAKDGDHTQINYIPLLSPKLISGTALSAHDKFEIYIHKAYSPAAVIYPLFGTAIKMARPNTNYPEEWQDGMGAFGRNYGNAITQRTAKTTAEFGTQVLLHEDPRYERSDTTNPIQRIGHAVGWTLFDKTDSGHRTLAASTFTGAAAGGFVGMAYLPDGYNDVTHAEQRMFAQIGGRVISNILTEFEPTWGPWARKLHIPRLLPEWWVPDHR